MNHITILGAERAIFTRMRVETGDGEAWRRDPEFFPKVRIDNAAGCYNQLFSQRGWHVLDRDMDSDRHDPNLGAGDHHHRCYGLARLTQREIGQKFRMTGKAESGFVKHGFRNRIGDNGRSPAFNRQETAISMALIVAWAAPTCG